MRTAGFALPPVNTCPTPGTCAIFCARILSEASYNCGTLSVSEVSPRIRIGDSDGLILRYVGLYGRFDGNWLRAALMAACTSRAAPLTSRFRSNCMVILQPPVDDDEVIWLMPAILLNCRSSGVAIEEAIVSGSAPGRLAPTEITGYSTCGRLATGGTAHARPPSRTPAPHAR